MSLIATSTEELEPGVKPAPGLATPPIGPDGAGDDQFAGYDDYYGFDEKELVFFPDGRQFVEIRKMTEGDRRKFLRATRQDVTFNQKSGDAKVPFDQGAERVALLQTCITNWHIVRRVQGKGLQLVPFSKQSEPGGRGQIGELEKWIDIADPELLGTIERAIRKMNPWLIAGEKTVEAIEKEMEELAELLEVAKRNQASGKDS